MPLVVTAWELEKHNNARNENKFYRIFHVGNTTITQWGRMGTAGQSKRVTRSSDEEAADYARKQFYSKRDRGYDTIVELFTFETELPSYGFSDTGWLLNAFVKAKRSAPHRARAKQATGILEQFVEQAYAMLNTVSNSNLQQLLTLQESGEYQAVLEAFDEINDRHEEAAAAIGMLRTMVQQKLTT